jgi:hypothetical protein
MARKPPPRLPKRRGMGPHLRMWEPSHPGQEVPPGVFTVRQFWALSPPEQGLHTAAGGRVVKEGRCNGR